jgi:hypothetical protein
VERKAWRVLAKLNGIRNLSADERLLFARSLAATPDERWQLHVRYLRSLGLSTRSRRKAFGFK